MNKTYSIPVTLDADAGETAEKRVMLDGVEYYVVAVPIDRLRTLRGGGPVTHSGGGFNKQAINLGPLNGPPSTCPVCGK